MHQLLLKRKCDIKLKKNNIRGDEISIVFLSLILLIILLFSCFRFLAVGKLVDDFIFTLLFGWTKYLVYLSLFVLIVPVFFNYYFKIKFSLILATILILFMVSWLVENITMTVNNNNGIWLNAHHFKITMINDYLSSWWHNSIINNYHGFFSSPISFISWSIADIFPLYASGGIISNLFILLTSYPFILNFLIFLCLFLITLSFLLFNQPFLFFQWIKKIFIKNKVANHRKAHLAQAVIISNQIDELDFNNKKPEANSFCKTKNIVASVIKQHAETRNKVTSSLTNDNDTELNHHLADNNNLKSELFIAKSNIKTSYNKENSILTPFGIKKINNVQDNQEKITNIIEENNILKLLEPNDLLTNANKVDKIVTQTLDNARINFKPEQVLENKQYVLPKLKSMSSETSRFKQLENERYALENKNKINQLFQEFSIQGKVENYHIGTTVTKFEISTVSGMRVNKITSLEDELKLSLANNNIRIEAPIPGKSLIGIEVANKNIVPVNLQEQISYLHESVNENKNLLISIGKTTMGKYLFHSLQEMPHLLIAGSTGAGKSVFINDLLMSILLQYQPSEVKLLLIDPKWVELTMYNGIAHLLAPVITEPHKVSPALQVIILEMMRRYKLFAKNTCRNIDSYNKKVTNPTDKLPYYLIVIDELADLMMQHGKEIEEGIMRITQMGRAAGIHLVVATQRPSINVITGVIKNNIPSRIAFQVASFVDSRTIIDSAGAEKLLGKGDMLFLTPANNGIIRVQAPWISEQEVIEIIEFIKKQGIATYDSNFIEAINRINQKNKN